MDWFDFFEILKKIAHVIEPILRKLNRNLFCQQIKAVLELNWHPNLLFRASCF